jgi:hypothetical protein
MGIKEVIADYLKIYKKKTKHSKMVINVNKI